jgi:hypothetical protein
MVLAIPSDYTIDLKLKYADIGMVNFCRTPQPADWLIFVVPLRRDTINMYFYDAL